MARQSDPKSRPRLPNLFTRAEWQILAESLGLTHRQVQIARLICMGLKNHELAVALGIAPDTVRMHRRALFERLNINDRIGVPVRLIVAHRALAAERAR